MRVLVADDDAVARSVVESVLLKAGHEAVGAIGGREAVAILEADDRPPMAIVDWILPEVDGLQVIRRLRERQVAEAAPVYVLLLTVRKRKQDIVEGLRAGANDYLTKPFETDELAARIQCGARMVELHQLLTGRINELRGALAEVRQLQCLLPICCYCKKVRNDRNYWQEIETYLHEHTLAEVNHGVCPDCLSLAESGRPKSRREE